jgi:23S rRNA pseudouridine2457 synthase
MSRYLAFNKPYEVLSQFTDSKGRRTLQEFIDIPGVYAAGRLDYRSEGLLILSDDGLMIHRLTDPDFTHKKTYLVQVEGVITDEAVKRLNHEILLPGIQTRLAHAEKIAAPDLAPRSKPVRDYHPTSWIRVELEEGKKHQVRKMTAAAGFPTLRLVRIAIGNISLGDLKPGEWRQLTRNEIDRLRAITGLR